MDPTKGLIESIKSILPLVNLNTSAFTRSKVSDIIVDGHEIYTEKESYRISINLISQNHTEEYFDQITRMVRDELIQSLIKNSSLLILKQSNADCLDFTGNLYPTTYAVSEENTRKVIQKISHSKIITNGRICSDIVDLALLTPSLRQNVSGFNFITEIGSINDSTIYVDSSMRYDSCYILMYKECLIDWNILDVSVEYNTISPVLHVNYRSEISVMDPNILYVFDDNNKKGREEYMLKQKQQEKETNINNLLNEN